MKITAQDMARGLLISCAFLLCSTTIAYAQSKIGVLTLHGVGNQRQGSGFDATLQEALKKNACKDTKIVVKTVYYHGKSCDRQAQLWKEYDRLEDKYPKLLDQKIARRIMLETVGDALAYSNCPNDKNSFYRRVHSKVRSSIEELETELGGSAPVVVVAHSLGCKVIFDYLCDVQTGQGIWDGKQCPSEFQKLSNLRLLITTGCSLPLFESAKPASEQRFFRVSKDFEWVNFYDRDDLLGWPLRPLGGRFKDIVQDEERNNVGSLLTSHVKYWKRDALNKEIADKILKLAVPNKPAGKNKR